MLTHLLTSHGYGVVTAANGADGLSAMRRHKPCLVLLDIMMPVMDGWQFRRLQLANDDRTFQPAEEIPLGPGTAPAGIAFADINADGKLDIATANYGSDTISIVLGNGDGQRNAVDGQDAAGHSQAR